MPSLTDFSNLSTNKTIDMYKLNKLDTDFNPKENKATLANTNLPIKSTNLLNNISAEEEKAILSKSLNFITDENKAKIANTNSPIKSTNLSNNILKGEEEKLTTKLQLQSSPIKIITNTEQAKDNKIVNKSSSFNFITNEVADKIDKTESLSTASLTTKSTLGDKFLPPKVNWSCPECYVSNKPELEKCPCCETPNPKLKTKAAEKNDDKKVTSNLSASLSSFTAPTDNKISFSSTGGFNFDSISSKNNFSSNSTFSKAVSDLNKANNPTTNKPFSFGNLPSTTKSQSDQTSVVVTSAPSFTFGKSTAEPTSLTNKSTTQSIFGNELSKTKEQSNLSTNLFSNNEKSSKEKEANLSSTSLFSVPPAENKPSMFSSTGGFNFESINNKTNFSSNATFSKGAFDLNKTNDNSENKAFQFTNITSTTKSADQIAAVPPTFTFGKSATEATNLTSKPATQLIFNNDTNKAKEQSNLSTLFSAPPTDNKTFSINPTFGNKSTIFGNSNLNQSTETANPLMANSNPLTNNLNSFSQFNSKPQFPTLPSTNVFSPQTNFTNGFASPAETNNMNNSISNNLFSSTNNQAPAPNFSFSALPPTFNFGSTQQPGLPQNNEVFQFNATPSEVQPNLLPITHGRQMKKAKRRLPQQP